MVGNPQWAVLASGDLHDAVWVSVGVLFMVCVGVALVATLDLHDAVSVSV